jgi:hypothetical protein
VIPLNFLSSRSVLQLWLSLLATWLLFELGSTATAQTFPELKTRRDTGAFMQTYYLQPRPELITDLVHALHSTGFLQKASAVPPVTGFFSEVFAANPDRLLSWQAEIAKQDEQTKNTLDRALSVSKAGGVLKIHGHSAELNDEYWGAFFASGNPDFIRKLVDQLRYFDERDIAELFYAGGTAKWSLASNAQSHPRVRMAIEEAMVRADERTQELITELLRQDPERIRQEVIKIGRKREGR